MLPLYYQNAYQTSCRATLVSTTQAGPHWEVILDQTCFYPEGGGQPGDHGHLNEISVIDTQKSPAGNIIHLITAPMREPRVEACIDWERRYHYMCQHSGQHIISAALYRMGYHTVSVHFGDAETSVEIARASISEEEVTQLEQCVNEIIRKNLVIRTYKSDHPEKEDLRRKPQKEGRIRVVEIEDWDRIGCGGVHVRRTGEVFLIKAMRTERMSRNMRIHFRIGKRALQDYQDRHHITQRLTTQLSTPLAELPGAVQLLQEKLQARKKELQTAWSYGARLLLPQLPRPCAEISQPLLFPYLVKLMVQESNPFCLVSSNGTDLKWAFITETEISASQLSTLLSPIKGKGGGKFPLYQGRGNDGSGIPGFFEEFRKTCIHRRFLS